MIDYILVDDNSLSVLYESIKEEKNELYHDEVMHSQYLQCCFFQINYCPNKEMIDNAIKGVSLPDDTKLYMFEDGDVLFKWPYQYDDDKSSSYCTDIQKHILKYFNSEIKETIELDKFFIYYNCSKGIHALTKEFIEKQRRLTTNSKKLLEYMDTTHLKETLANTISMVSVQRFTRSKPHILIVEDQIFSQKILLTILKDYSCHVTKNIADGLLAYVEKCPDIVFLDIDLPDLNGHHLANFINKIDPNSYVVMVTSSNFTQDVKIAKENNVKGFIPKPYKKEIILDTIDKFSKNRSKQTL